MIAILEIEILLEKYACPANIEGDLPIIDDVEIVMQISELREPMFDNFIEERVCIIH